MLDLLFVILFIVSLFIIFSRRTGLKLFKRREDDELEMQEIENALVVWAAENPDKNFSHPDAQKIIRKCIRRMNRFKDAHPDVDVEGRIAKLIGLLT